MAYLFERPDGVVIRSTTGADVDQLEQLQIAVFPTLADTSRLKAPHYLRHIEIFPEGQFVAAIGNRVVGMTTSMRVKEKVALEPHRFEDLISGGWLYHHDPAGDCMYGVDMGTAPDCRGMGIARDLYKARHQSVKALGLKGQYLVGMLNGFAAFSSQLSIEEYYKKVIGGEILDPTVGAQIRMGFEPRGLVRDYLDDPVCGDAGVLLVLSAELEIR